MKIFEFAFNPQKRKDRFFEAFSYEPKSPKEKPKGSLYAVGELNNALEFNSKFLKHLFATIQQEYYASSFKGAGPALKAALKKANLFLATENKKGNVDWLGNLHLAILLFITVKEKKTVFYLAKTGNAKVHLARERILTDIGKNIETSSPGKIFSNLVSGSLAPNDAVLVQNKEVFDILSKEKSLEELGAFKEAKQFREFFSKHHHMLSQSSGMLISFVVEEETAKRSPLDKSLLPSLPKPKLMLPKGMQLPMPKVKIKFPWMRNPAAFKKHSTLITLLLALLLLGALLFS